MSETTTSESYFSENSEISIVSETSTKKNQKKNNNFENFYDKNKYFFGMIFCFSLFISGGILAIIIIIEFYLDTNPYESIIVLNQKNSTNLFLYRTDEDTNFFEKLEYFECNILCKICKGFNKDLEWTCISTQKIEYKAYRECKSLVYECEKYECEEIGEVFCEKGGEVPPIFP